MLAGPVFVQFVPSVHGMVCLQGQTVPQCMCSGPSPSQSPSALLELHQHAGNNRQEHT